MAWIREYLLSVTTAAILCTVLRHLLAGKGTATSIGKVLTGIFMTVAVLGPAAQIRLSDLSDLQLDISQQTQDAVRHGQEAAQSKLKESISQRLEAYILDKASDMHVQLQVSVELSDDPIPMPVRVRLHGNVSPYAKGKLQKIIRDELGIDKENQLWT